MSVLAQAPIRSDERSSGGWELRTLRCCERERNYDHTSLAFALEACASDSVRGTMGPMECIFCGKALPQGSSSRKQFCDDSHRASYWREHSALSPKGKRGKHPNGAKAQVGARRKEKPAGRTPQTPRVRQHTSAHTASRIPMAEQLRGLAPEGAVGYRLVLQTRSIDDVPRLSPPLDATGYQGHYSLSPFQAPYDIRLMDGQTYRVVWTGVSGEVIPPKPNGTIPGLHFFLTSSASPVGIEAEASSCDSPSTDGTEPVNPDTIVAGNQTKVDQKRELTPVLDARLSTHNLTVTERLTKAMATVLPALQELLTCLTIVADWTVKVGEQSGTPSPSEVATDTSAEHAVPQESVVQESVSPQESVTTRESVAESEPTPQSETPSDGTGVPPQATSAQATADPPPQAEFAQPWDAHPMSAEERQQVIRLALDEDKMTLICRELFIRSHSGETHHPPIDSTYVPKAEDAKDLASIEGKPVIWGAVSELYQAVTRAPSVNPSGEYQQPNHIPSLRDFEKQRVRTAFRSTEQRVYFEYLIRRRCAIRLGRAIPPPPKSTSGFNREARRELEQFFRDTRTSALMTALLEQVWEAEEKTVQKDSVLSPSLQALRDA